MTSEGETGLKKPENWANTGRGWGYGAEGDRTLDLRIANATLSQLSYRPTQGARF
jgi:hypothetical protein